jgi:L-ribulose-5-phosphate 3-epimerase
MQGRLSPLVKKRIQAFPAKHWREEYAVAQKLGFESMEWTLDHENLAENPLMTPAGREEIITLSKKHEISLRSVTGDCFMQAPFWKNQGSLQKQLQEEFLAVVEACSKLKVSLLVLPLVDEGQLKNIAESKKLTDFLISNTGAFANYQIKIALETDFTPEAVAALLEPLDADVFGINYDIGNSAGLGYSYKDEFQCYGSQILHVHVKDRVLGGSTVPLGKGAADFPGVFRLLASLGYQGNFVLQTARAADGDHAGVLARYRHMVSTWISESYES